MDESGVVFCAQPVAIIPTHLIVYSAKGKKQDSKNEPKASTYLIFPPVYLSSLGVCSSNTREPRPRHGQLVESLPSFAFPSLPFFPRVASGWEST